MKTALSLAALLAVSAVPAFAAFTGFPKPFTATTTQPDGTTWVTSYKGTRFRSAPKDAPSMGVLLGDLSDGSVSWVFDDSKEYYAYKGSVEEDVLDPCFAKKSVEAQGAQGVSCKKEGSAVVNGRKTDKYVTRMEGSDQTVESYFDPELKVVVKHQTPDGGMRELKDIKVGAAGGSFEVPKGYKLLSKEQYNAKMIQASRSRSRKRK